MDCCVANQVLILTSINKTFAPCTMDIIYNYCPKVSTSNFCPNGTLADLGTIQAYIKLNATTKGLPIMSNYIGYGTFRKVITAPLGLEPQQVVVLSYKYFNGNVAQGQNSNGATSGEFRYQIMLSGSSSSKWSSTITAMGKPQYVGAIATFYGNTPTKVPFKIEKTQYYVADPIEIPNSSFMIQSWSFIQTSILSILLGIILIYLK